MINEAEVAIFFNRINEAIRFRIIKSCILNAVKIDYKGNPKKGLTIMLTISMAGEKLSLFYVAKEEQILVKNNSEKIQKFSKTRDFTQLVGWDNLLLKIIYDFCVPSSILDQFG
jgi:hypothetical protein